MDSTFNFQGVYGDDLPSPHPAPLVIRKVPSRAQSIASRHTRQSSSRSRPTTSSRSQGQVSPPLTPRTSREALSSNAIPQMIFHHYLRAFHHFHPTFTVTSSGDDESSIMVPINQGDVVLVHSVHPNGWADGTLLISGRRGWLPTNYCEPYEPSLMQILLNSLTNVWDLVRGGGDGELTAFTRQDYVRRMIAGVRFLLERTHCLTRESTLIQSHPRLHRLRKGMLADLSSMVKTAKKLQACLETNVDLSATILGLLDEVILKAMKVVTRAVRFLDTWKEHEATRPTHLDHVQENNRPLTPPVDAISSQLRLEGSIGSPSSMGDRSDAVSQSGVGAGRAQYEVSASSSRLAPPTQRQSLSPVGFTQTNRLSTVSHRASYHMKLGPNTHLLASKRLSATEDAFLGFLASFVGSHLESRDPKDVLETTRSSVDACIQMLCVLEEVWVRGSRTARSLETASDIMYERLGELVKVTTAIYRVDELSPDDGIVPADLVEQLVNAAASCVRSAGECVNLTKIEIETIGDFECEREALGMAEVAKLEAFRALHDPSSNEHHAITTETERSLSGPTQTTAQQQDASRNSIFDKPLPKPPVLSPTPQMDVAPAVLPQSPVTSSSQASRSSIRELPHLPIPRLLKAQITPSEASPISVNSKASIEGARVESVNTSVADSASTYPNSIRGGSAGSVVSRASTRATTPDQSLVTRTVDQPSLLSSFGSESELQSAATEDAVKVEEQLLGKTYAHELVYNKDGQISGGSLPALVERLTTHDSTPDAMFVTTFYLTFRLFTTSVEFAQCLIERFDYVGTSQEVGVPVRLRVYNVFKGWLESHWQASSDSEALGIILTFATGKLRVALPPAGKRLAELTSKVTEVRAGALVPRLVSSMGKTSTSSTVFSAIEANAPKPLIKQAQIENLKAANQGGARCSILDFDPVELARQITLIESRMFCSIQPEELLASEWMKKVDSKAVNVKAMSTISTDLTNLVADTILNLEDAKKRAQVIKRWVKIASEFLELNNYDSLMAVICSLNSSMVTRLKRTWEIVPKNTKARFEELKAIVDSGRNFAVLRQRLQNHVAPCIPFVGIYLTDLTFVDVGNQTTRQLRGDGTGEGVSVINFDKHMRTAKIIGQLQRFQVPYRLLPVPEMQEWMEAQIKRVRANDQANVQQYYRRSLLLEPREVQKLQKVNTAPDTGSSTLTSNGNREASSKDRFDFLTNFHFGSMTSSKEKA